MFVVFVPSLLLMVCGSLVGMNVRAVGFDRVAVVGFDGGEVPGWSFQPEFPSFSSVLFGIDFEALFKTALFDRVFYLLRILYYILYSGYTHALCLCAVGGVCFLDYVAVGSLTLGEGVKIVSCSSMLAT